MSDYADHDQIHGPHEMQDEQRHDDDMSMLPALVRNAVSIPEQGTPITLCPTNVDIRTRYGKSCLLKMAGPATESLRDKREVRIKAVYWALLPDVKPDEKTGDMVEVVYVCFMAEDGSTFRTTAEHGPARLLAMLQLFEQEEWHDGIDIVITERKSRRGTTYHDIQVDCGDSYRA